MNKAIRLLLGTLLVAGSLVLACGPVPDNQIPTDYARVTFLLKSQQGKTPIAEGVVEAWVEIAEVSVHYAKGGGWQVVTSQPAVIDLLRLPEQVVQLGIADLPTGRITQIRLYVAEDSDSYVVMEDGSQVPMKVPSGDRSGIKLLGHWDIAECTENIIGLTILDHHSALHVHPNGHEDLYIFRPVIKLDELITEEGECDDPPDDGDTPNDTDDPDNQDFDDCIPGDDTNDCPDDGEGTDPNDGDNPPDDGDNPPDDGDNPPDDGDNPPDDGDNPPDDGENPPDDGENPPDDGENPPDDGENPPDDGENPPDDDCDPAVDDAC